MNPRTRRKRFRTKRSNAYNIAMMKLRTGLPCAYCGKTGDILEFHHRNKEDKIDTIGELIYKGVQHRIFFEELAKCDPICAECHDKIHPRERKNRKKTRLERKILIVKEMKRRKKMAVKHKCDNCGKVIRKRHHIKKDGKDMKVCFGCKERYSNE